MFSLCRSCLQIHLEVKVTKLHLSYNAKCGDNVDILKELQFKLRWNITTYRTSCIILVPGCALCTSRFESIFLFDDGMELFRSESWRFHREKYFFSTVVKQPFIANCMRVIQVKSIWVTNDEFRKYFDSYDQC